MRKSAKLIGARRTAILSILAIGTLAIGCSPEVGSDTWCEKLKETPKADWSSNDAAAFAKNCIFK